VAPGEGWGLALAAKLRCHHEGAAGNTVIWMVLFAKWLYGRGFFKAAWGCGQSGAPGSRDSATTVAGVS
jgi:hypothetical protein